MEDTGLQLTTNKCETLIQGATVSELTVNQAKPTGPAAKKSVVEILTRKGSEIVHGKKEYLYKPYFPMGKFSVITADPGTGKTKLTIAIAAKVTRGESICGIPCQHPGNVVIFSREDDADDIVTTFCACGGDPEKLFVFADDEEAIKYMTNKPLYFGSPEIEAIISAYHPTLVIFDPMQKYLPPKVDTYRNNQTAAALLPVLNLSAKYDCHVLIVTHNVKMKAGLSLQGRVNGSSDITGESRSTLAVVPDPISREPGTNLVIHCKSNNRIGKAIQYRIESIDGDEDFATVKFLGLKDYYERDYMRESNRGTYGDEDPITDDDPVVGTILAMMVENPKGFKISKDTLSDSVFEYTDETVNIILKDIIRDYGDYMKSKHGIGMQTIESTTESEIIRSGKAIRTGYKGRVLAIRKNPARSKKH